MDTLSAIAMGYATRRDEPMVFDWDKAAQLIRDSKCSHASAGLRSDWEWTGGTIFEDGKPVKSDYTYLSSTWAVPEIEINGEVMPCYRMKSEVPRWDANTKWPKSALDILKSTTKDTTN